MNKYMKSKRNMDKKSESKNKLILRQIDEIDSLKKTVSELIVDCSEKESIIDSIDVIRNDLLEVVAELKNKSAEYDCLIDELTKMRNTMNEIAFHKRWKLIRFLLK